MKRSCYSCSNDKRGAKPTFVRTITKWRSMNNPLNSKTVHVNLTNNVSHCKQAMLTYNWLRRETITRRNCTMQLDVRNYLKKVRRSENLDELEKELNDLIAESRQYKEPIYDKSPILQWFATKKLQADQNKAA